MSGCPYTWFKGLIAGQATGTSAQALRVRVKRNNETVVDVSLPARSARWLIDLIPDHVLEAIQREGIPIESIQGELATREELLVQKIFSIEEPSRVVEVWLE